MQCSQCFDIAVLELLSYDGAFPLLRNVRAVERVPAHLSGMLLPKGKLVLSEE